MQDISNYYERLVIDQLWELAQDQEEALSRSFLNDVACLALNKLPHCYVCNTVDKRLSLSDQDYDEMNAAVRKALSEAMNQVRQFPHDNRDI